MTEQLKKTPLFNTYETMGAKVIDFSGWALPVQFSSIKEEHIAVRENVGMFDVSHMGEIFVSGQDATAFLNYVLTNDVMKATVTKAQYTILCNEHGGTIDDLVLYKLGEEEYLLVVNAGNTEIDYEWLVEQANNYTVSIDNRSNNFGQLAIQGPNAVDIVSELTDESIDDMKLFEFIRHVKIDGKDVLLSKSGYTGEDGFEIYCHAKDTVELWDKFIELGVEPCGLGARDTLRLEAGLPLHGQDLSEEITPIEAGVGFAVKVNKESDFIGKDKLAEQKENGPKVKSVGLELLERGIARTDYTVLSENGEEIGYVTSGTKSPLTDKSIAVALINSEFAQVDKEVIVQVRKKEVRAKVVKKPFHK